MSNLRALQEALPRWVRLERRPDAPEVTESQVGDVRVVEVMAYPEAPPEGTMATEGRADVHFVLVAPTEGFPGARRARRRWCSAALGEGVFKPLTAKDLMQGPSYITLGHWLGNQDLALMLIGAVQIAGIAPALTPPC